MNTYHLKPDDGDWTLTQEGVEKPIAAFSDNRVALNAARDLADRRKGRLVVFRQDGTIAERRGPPVDFASD
jgi:hypothetical protein